MGKTLVLAEKPSVGRDLARVLGCHGGEKGYFENRNYIVTWALGHLVTLADPEVYAEKFKTWRLEDLPILPEKLSAFEARKQKEGSRVSRKEVSKYLKEQKQEKSTPLNTALADALEKLK